MRGQVAAGFGVAGAHQHAAVLRLQREDVAGLDEVARPRRRGATAACTVRARSAAEMPVVTPSAASIDTVKAVPCLVPLLRRHRRQVQALAALARQRQADQAAGVARHEVDRLGRDVVGGEDQVAFVLAVLLVDQDDHAAGGELGDDFLDRGNRRGRTRGAGAPIGVTEAFIRLCPWNTWQREAPARRLEHALDVARDQCRSRD